MTRIRPATRALTVAAATIPLLAAACGGSSAAGDDGKQACVDAAGARAEAAFIQRAYHDGRVGSASAIRRDVSKFEQDVPFKVTSFLRPNGTMIPWSQMSNSQQRTFESWAHAYATTIPQAVSQEATQALLRAKAAAKTSCER